MIDTWLDSLFGGLRKKRRRKRTKRSFVELFSCFRELLELNNKILTAMASMNDKLGGSYIFDRQYIRSASRELEDLVHKLIAALDALTPEKYLDLNKAFRDICAEIESELAGHMVIPASHMVLGFKEITAGDMEAVGAKNAHLAELNNVLELNVPQGMAATTMAFQTYMEHNMLNQTIAKLEADWRAGKITVDTASEKIRERILAGELPTRLRKALNRATETLRQAMGNQELGLAVRSSAWGEDGEHSFAGQYVSLLNEPLNHLRNAYRQVLAGAYSASAMEYRHDMGFSENEVFMAVSFQVMVQARTSGVVYSLSPQNPDENILVIAGSWGLGAVVAGRAVADRFTVSRDSPHRQLSVSVVRKEHALRALPEGGVRLEHVPTELQTKGCLNADEILLLTQTALQLERYFKKPQDMEFAFDDEGRLFVLQTRPLRIQTREENKQRARDLCESLQNYPVLMSGQGDVAQQGIATGPVFLIRNERELDEFPDGAIVVARYSSPALSTLLRRATGVITDVGSSVGHMATIAREYRVPALLNTKKATQILTDGQMITLDAEQKVVYRGQVKELCLHDLTSEPIEESYEYRLLRRVLKRIDPLNLVDPSDRNFSPEGCLTLHDITRFVHEKAVEELLNINYATDVDSSNLSGQLNLPVPLDLMIMDIGGGLAAESSDAVSSVPARRRIIKPDQVISMPMRAFIHGVTWPGVWQSTPAPVDFSSFMSSLTRTFSSDLADPQYIGQNLSVISDRYAHLSLRLGYHFTMIDCYVTEKMADNYAYFRFTGGVTGTTRRTRRARFLAEVLSRHDFVTTIQQDLVVGRIKKFTVPAMLRRVRILGLLVAYTRQLDVSMVDDDQIDKHVEAFEDLVNTAV